MDIGDGVRHGDVYIEKVREIPRWAKSRLEVDSDGVLAYGEATGHAHRVSGGTVLTYRDQRYIQVEEDADVTHEEHDTLTLDAGIYRVTTQREYEPGMGSRRVLD